MTFPILPNHSDVTSPSIPGRATYPTLPGRATLLALSVPLDSPNLACPVLATRLTQPGRLTDQPRPNPIA